MSLSPLSVTALYTLIFLLFLSSFLLTAARNVTIDDQMGDAETGSPVIYQPDGMWQQGAGCSTCVLKPDESAPYDQTWHDSTYVGQTPDPFSFTMLFNGEATAAYVYFILAQGADAVYSPMLLFTIDGQAAGSYRYDPSETDVTVDYTYNFSVYANEDLAPLAGGSDSMHNLTVTSLGGALFDYAIYTVPDDLVQSPASNTPTIAPSPVPSSTSESSSSTTVDSVSSPLTSTSDSSTPTSSTASSSTSVASEPTFTSTTTSLSTWPTITTSSSADPAHVTGTTATVSSHSRTVVSAVGATLGIITILSILLVLLLLWRKRKQKQVHRFIDLIDTRLAQTAPTPFDYSSALSVAEDGLSSTVSKPASVLTAGSVGSKHDEDEVSRLRERLALLEAQQRQPSTSTLSQMTKSPPPLYDQLTVRGSYGAFAI